MEHNTKDAILDAAEQLFSRYGFATTSLRQITEAAGVNLAAVNYHFGTKSALISRVLQRIFIPLAEERQRNFAQITAGGKMPSLEALLHAYYVPFFAMIQSQSALGERRRQIFGRLANEPDEEIRQHAIQVVSPITEKYFWAFRQAVPHLPMDEFVWRFKMMHGMVTAHITNALLPTLPSAGNEEVSEEQDLAWLITYLTASWQTGATEVNSSTTHL